ncbi:MAG: zinc dependent phospholipase C family protein, partial [Anaerolineae bacterium]|nr:zinc dependent phospholipase C family protein [Anaerolineae bacterium]
MPTPFTHLAAAQRLLNDPAVPESSRSALARERAAFLLGNIAADARISDGVTRETTHFFAYDRPIETHPWRVMLATHPDLHNATSAAQQAFLAGYTAHLSMDEIWSLEMVRPYFAESTWGNRRLRFLMLHIILIYMDERDYRLLEDWQRGALCGAAPEGWTPFLSDTALVDWRNFIGVQLRPGGDSQTLQVLG